MIELCSHLLMLTENDIINRILKIRSKKVMIDRDLAELYGVTTSG